MAARSISSRVGSNFFSLSVGSAHADVVLHAGDVNCGTDKSMACVLEVGVQTGERDVQSGAETGAGATGTATEKQTSAMKRIFLVLWAALCVAGAAAAADNVKIGFLSTLSGPNAAIGLDIKDGFE